MTVALLLVLLMQDEAPTPAAAERPRAEALVRLDPAIKEMARAAAGHGQRLYDAREYDKALASFQAAYRLVPHPDFLFNVALSQQALGQHKEAADSFERYLRELPEVKDPATSPEEVAYATRTIVELRARGGAAEPPSGPPAPLPVSSPPPSPPRPVATTTLTADAPPVSRPPPANPTLKRLGYVLLGTGVAAGLAAGACFWRAESLESSLEMRDPKAPWDAAAQGKERSGHRMVLAGRVLAGVAGAALVGGAASYWYAARPSGEAPTTVSLEAGDGQWALVVGGRF